MLLLLFKKQFFESIRAGQKRTTIRRWTKPRVCAGKQAFTPGLGWISIECVDVVLLRELDDVDAQADGFASAEQIRRELRRLYPAIKRDGKHWFRVRFSLTFE
ncbi:MAG TPA: ASCH domain-containing protein [Tepidisphaeraceae bacterium]|jgi:hypothetical protein